MKFNSREIKDKLTDDSNIDRLTNLVVDSCVDDFVEEKSQGFFASRRRVRRVKKRKMSRKKRVEKATRDEDLRFLIGNKVRF